MFKPKKKLPTQEEFDANTVDEDFDEEEAAMPQKMKQEKVMARMQQPQAQQRYTQEIEPEPEEEIAEQEQVHPIKTPGSVISREEVLDMIEGNLMRVAQLTQYLRQQ